MPASAAPAMASAPKAPNAEVAHQPMPTPATAPSTLMTRLSVRSCATRRPRDAPSAVRTANSRWREAPAASSRLARFAQAISSTSPTAADSSIRL